MQLKQIYEKYQVPNNLQKHQLRVAALSEILIENWQGKEIDRQKVILAGLFHDMANIIKFDFSKPPLFKDEEKLIGLLQKIQQKMIKKYGNNLHLATLTICREIGLDQKIVNLIDKLEWNNLIEILKAEDFETAISIYADMRIGPYGILLLEDRINNLKKRNNIHEWSFIHKVSAELEKTIKKFIPINLNTITDSQLNQRFSSFINLEIKQYCHVSRSKSIKNMI